MFGYYSPVKLFTNLIPARFTSRPNRFVVECLVDVRTVRAYLPNPGRLWELFFPGAKLYLTRFPPSSERRLKHMAVAVERDGVPVARKVGTKVEMLADLKPADVDAARQRLLRDPRLLMHAQVAGSVQVEG